MGREIMEKTPPAADRRIAYGAEPQQFGELRLGAGDGPRPVAMLIHGGFWRIQRDLSHMGHLGAALAAEGISSWSVEYRRIGEPGGGYPGTLEDVARAAAFLPGLANEFPLDLRSVIAIGFSAGGHLALWLAGERVLPLRGVISLGGVADLRHAWRLGLGDGVTEEFLGGPPDAVPDRYRHASPAERLPLGLRQVLIHGTEDDVVPIAISREYHRMAEAECTLHEIPGGDHFAPMDPASAAWPVVRGAIRGMI